MLELYLKTLKPFKTLFTHINLTGIQHICSFARVMLTVSREEWRRSLKYEATAISQLA